MAGPQNRRPLKSRDSRWAARISRWLAGRGVTANQISAASMGAGGLAGLAFWLGAGSDAPGLRAGLLLIGALLVQARLLCNLFDGMVAIEAGQSAADGPFWNEFPDRVSDIAIFVGLGHGLGLPALGWAAATAAVLTAYVRELGVNTGLAADYSGPMAKQHRMALITGAALLSLVEGHWIRPGGVLMLALWAVAIGGGLTAARRALAVRQGLLRRGKADPGLQRCDIHPQPAARTQGQGQAGHGSAPGHGGKIVL